jgi:hypothetical protein
MSSRRESEPRLVPRPRNAHLYTHHCLRDPQLYLQISAGICREVCEALYILQQPADAVGTGDVCAAAAMLLNAVLMLSAAGRADPYAVHAQRAIACCREGAQDELALHLAALRRFDIDAYL